METEKRIDVLRGVAALAVALFHVRSDMWVGWTAMHSNPDDFSVLDKTLAWLGIPMRFMGSGVLLFFVISGYCIHRPQAERKAKNQKPEKPRVEHGGPSVIKSFQLSEFQFSAFSQPNGPSWFRFFIRRFLRIYPPYLVALLLSGLVLMVTSGMTREGWNRLLASLPMLQNYWTPGGQIPANPSLWSLPVEMELYLIYPLAWWVGRTVGWTWMLVLAILVSFVGQWASLQGMQWLDGSFPRFWALWCAGAVVAEWQQRGALPRWSFGWGVLLVVTLVCAGGAELSEQVRQLALWFWGLAGVLCLICAVGPGSDQKKTGVWVRWTAWIGTMSFSLYLIHYPLFLWAGVAWQNAFGGKPTGIWVPLTAVALAIPLAWVFYLLIERPAHRLARWCGKERR